MNPEILDQCENFGDVFELVKKSVEQTLKLRRGGLMLYLADLTPSIGALHGLGSNGIVVNRIVLNAVTGLTKSRRELNSFIYSILLHEYLHSLGYVDEFKVRQLAVKIARETFGEGHPTAKMAANPMGFFPNLIYTESPLTEGNLTLIKDFDRGSQRYYI